MSELDLHFDGLKPPVRITDPDVVMPLLAPAFRQWPFKEAPVDTAVAPFAMIGPAEDGVKWRLTTPLGEKEEVLRDPIDGICDLIVEISWERLRSRPDLLCLHAAAVPFGDRLVLFPNTRRAGKSLLSATLARRGFPVFTDDFIPLAVDPVTRVISGVANGIAPRLRLPVPETLAEDHAAWIYDHITSRNKRYGYLSEIDLPLSGTEMPVGAIVLLDRDMEMAGPPQLSKVGADEAIAAVVKQNFGRQVHAGAILTITEVIAMSVPVMRLTYHDVDAAAELLSQTPALKNLPAARISAEGRPTPDRLAPVGTARPEPPEPFDMGLTFARVPGYTEVETDQTVYLASARGMTIQRLNPVSVMIWKLMEEPISGEDIVAVLAEVFPDVAPETLQGDTRTALRYLIKDGLVQVS